MKEADLIKSYILYDSMYITHGTSSKWQNYRDREETSGPQGTETRGEEVTIKGVVQENFSWWGNILYNHDGGDGYTIL